MLKQDAANPSPHRVFPVRINVIGLKYLTTDLQPLHFQMLFLKHTEHFIRKTAPHEFNSLKINHKLLVSFCIFQNSSCMGSRNRIHKKLLSDCILSLLKGVLLLFASSVTTLYFNCSGSSTS